MLCNLPTPIVLQHERSCIKQKFERKTRQQDRDFVNLLIEIRLNEKEGTQRTFSRTKVDVTWIVPMCVTVTFSPLGNWIKVVIELVILVNKVTEWIIWFIAPVSRTKVSPLKAVLFTRLTANTECCTLKTTESWNKSQELPEATVGLIAELTKWMPSHEPYEKACVLSIEINCWHYSEVKGKLLLHCCVSSDWDWSPW